MRQTAAGTGSVARRVLALALCALCALFICGCRDTDVLTEVIIGDVGQYELDETLPPVSVKDNAQESTTSEEEGDSDRTDYAPEYDEADYGEDEPDSEEETAQNTESDHQRDDAPDSLKGDSDSGEGTSLADTAPDDAGGGDGTGDGDGDGGRGKSEKPAPIYIPIFSPNADDEFGGGEDISSGDDGNNESDPDWQDPDLNPDDPGTQDPDEEDDPEGPDDEAQEPTPPPVVVQPGDYSELPTSKRIAASAPYAAIVQALGGPGSLVACDAEWLSSVPSGAFGNGAELADVVGISGWSQGEPFTDDVVKQIVASGATCLAYGPGQALAEGQVEYLTANGVSLLALPRIGAPDALDSDIVLSVQAIGQTLANAGNTYTVGGATYTSEDTMNHWVSLHNEALSNTKSANGGYTTMMGFNRFYQDDISSSLTPSPASPNRVFTAFIDSWAPARDGGAGGVGMGLPLTPVSRSYGVIEYYLQHAGAASVTVTRGSRSAFGVDHAQSEEVGHLGQIVKIDGSRYPTGGGGGVVGRSELTGLKEYGSSGNIISTSRLGDAKFPALIVRDESIVERVKASARQPYDDAKARGWYNVGQDFNILIMPKGVAGSWADGTFESFLVAPWAYGKLQGGGLGATCDSYVADFYESFYRWDPSTDIGTCLSYYASGGDHRALE